MLHLDDLAKFLEHFLAVHQFSHAERGGVYLPSTRPISKLGLALEPWSQITKWAAHHHLDALFLHRPWKLQTEQLPQNVGVISYHLAFDERLTLGFNPRLADVLAMSTLSVLGKKEGRPIGMIGQIPTQSFSSYCSCVNEVFDGHDEAHIGLHTETSQVAVVGAMTDTLVREAAERGADVYITGQFRKSASSTVSETGIGIIAVGHHRCEEWGLRAIAGVLRERWSRLEVVLPPG